MCLEKSESKFTVSAELLWEHEISEITYDDINLSPCIYINNFDLELCLSSFHNCEAYKKLLSPTWLKYTCAVNTLHGRLL